MPSCDYKILIPKFGLQLSGMVYNCRVVCFLGKACGFCPFDSAAIVNLQECICVRVFVFNLFIYKTKISLSISLQLPLCDDFIFRKLWNLFNRKFNLHNLTYDSTFVIFVAFHFQPTHIDVLQIYYVYIEHISALVNLYISYEWILFVQILVFRLLVLDFHMKMNFQTSSFTLRTHIAGE